MMMVDPLLKWETALYTREQQYTPESLALASMMDPLHSFAQLSSRFTILVSIVSISPVLGFTRSQVTVQHNALRPPRWQLKVKESPALTSTLLGDSSRESTGKKEEKRSQTWMPYSEHYIHSYIHSLHTYIGLPTKPAYMGYIHTYIRLKTSPS